MYGNAMREKLPISDFKWVSSDDELYSNADSIKRLSDDSEYGYIFEVDLYYPKELHDLHNDYPFCAERRQLPDEVFDIIKTKKVKSKNYCLHSMKKKIMLSTIEC